MKRDSWEVKPTIFTLCYSDVVNLIIKERVRVFYQIVPYNAFITL